ncbi:hypothetical protein CJD36_018800 [Flavipsychrobacter stenotrophus]|uniref:histidine kinase n=1 Tax=Flavipsychrobacter stenotrophus TaxID=2077091 RepID=A0A2S7SQW5_9BACT|nr:histidine kinase dimerization/phosphoacceptor domain -containing protein [Flavipsychrobacter stenotrophus]PQJ09299.1 hypothetical protein CJD36_018800 [Flavipsychrobacter stenotrophus]
MRKILFVLCFAISVLYVGIAGAVLNTKGQIDSMLKELPRKKNDTDKVLMLYKMCHLYSLSNPYKGLPYAKYMMGLATQIRYARGIGLAHSSLAYNYEKLSDFKAAAQNYELSAKVFEPTGDSFNVQIAYANAGNMYDELGNYGRALEFDFKALDIAERMGEKGAIQIDLGNIGIVYKEMEKYGEAIDYNDRSLKIALELKDSLEVARLFANIANCYHLWDSAGNEQRALDYNRRAFLLNKILGDSAGQARVLGNTGSIYIALKKYDSAIFCNTEAIKIYRQGGSTGNSYALVLAGLGEAYYRLAKDSILQGPKNNYGVSSKEEALALSIDNSQQALAIFMAIGNLEVASHVLGNLGGAYALQGNYKNAYEMIIKHNDLKDSMDKVNNLEKIANIETERALLVKEKQIEADNRKSLERKFFFSVTGLLIVILSIVGWNFYRQRKLTAQKTKLANQKEVLLQEKDILIKEIHHRVKNNLQVVVSLLDLQTANTEDKVAKRTMTESAARVKSISLIHRFLYQHEDVTGIEYAHFIRELFTQVVTVFKTPGQTITLDEQVPETILDIDTAVPMGLILNELLINSFKYAFPTTDGNISITMSASDGGYNLTYKDSGSGLPIGYDPKKATTMGMTIMLSLARQVGGTFTYDHAQNMFIINFTDLLGRKLIS